VIRMLNDLGVSTNANDNTLTNVDTTKLQDALTNNLSDVKALFNDPINGLTTTVQNVIASYNDSLSGALVNEEKDIQRQVTFNQAQITTMQGRLNTEQTILQNEFAALDTAESKAKSLSGIISGTSSSSDSGALSSLGSIGSNSSSSSSG
jgi:flagellar capping protein FliD